MTNLDIVVHYPDVVTITINDDGTYTLDIHNDFAAARAIRSYAFFTEDPVLAKRLRTSLACPKCGSRGRDYKGIVYECPNKIRCGWIRQQRPEGRKDQ